MISVDPGPVDPAHVVIVAAVVLAWLVMWMSAVASILRRPELTGFERGAWVIVVVVFPFLGPLVWFVWGRTRRRNRAA